MYVEKEQWFLLLTVGLIAIVSINVALAKRDYKYLNPIQESEVVYKQLPVIPFANEQL